MRKTLYLIIASFIFSSCALAQKPVSNPSLEWLLSMQDSLHKRLPVEKAYLQTDKPFYAVGDTIWLKAYLFNADYFTNSTRSGLLCIELANDSAAIVARMMLPLADGVGSAQIVIDGSDIPEGSYTLRAYTNWMRNFNDDYIFKKNIYITGTGNKPWLVNVQSGSSIENGKENVHASLLFSDASNQKILLREMQLSVQDGNRTLFKSKTQTNLAGTVDFNFNLPAKDLANNLSIHAQDLRKGEENRHINIPLVLNRPENTDLQFMPEGGSLINGILSKVGFKAIGENGYGVNITGKVYNSTQEEVATFSSSHKGMGSFMLTPQSGETYTVKINLPNGQSKTYPLPQVKNTGTSLAVEDRGDDSLKIKLAITTDLMGSQFYLVGQSRNVICTARVIAFQSTNRSVSIPKDLFPSGIARFSLLNRLGQPLNERMVYIDRNDDLKIDINTAKLTYALRDSITLNIKVTDKFDKPIQGSFSLAVTDDGQVPIDSLRQNSLTTNLLLTSELKGTVEDPGYYLHPQNKPARDNLLLTQGWTSYDWQQVTGSVGPVLFAAEPEFRVTGNVTNFFNKPVTGSRITILSKKPFFTKITKTDAKGNFVFDDFPVVDSALFFVEATNRRGKNDGVGIVVDQPIPPEFSKSTIRYLPWFVNTDTIMQKSVRKAISQRLEEEKLTGDHVLKEVNIKEKKIIKGSHNKNEDGGADLVLDEKAMEKAGDMTLEEMMTKNVRFFNVRLWGSRPFYMIGDWYYVVLYIDGIPIKTRGEYRSTKYYMDNFTAKEIRSIELMTSVKYIFAYDRGIMSERAGKYPAPIFIEVTTKAGTGPFKQKTPGAYVYRPLPFAIPKQFYRPKYTVKGIAGALKDLRSTIHWEPNVITDKDGKATVAFYASDSPGTYSVIMEGSDMNGNIGSKLQEITIKGNAQ